MKLFSNLQLNSIQIEKKNNFGNPMQKQMHTAQSAMYSLNKNKLNKKHKEQLNEKKNISIKDIMSSISLLEEKKDLEN